MGAAPAQLQSQPQAWLSKARGGDVAALERLLRHHRPAMHTLCRRMCATAAEADDVLQETCLAVVAGITSFRGEGNFMGWVYTLVRTHRGRWIRAASRRRRRLAELAADPLRCVDPPGLDAAVSARELAERLQAALASIGSVDRDVAVLRDIEELSAAEVAARLGLSVPAVKSRLHRARARLRSELSPELAA